MKLSIITVNLNNREGLQKTLDSVAAQTWRDFEHIIIDGASTDGSVDIIREYAKGSESRSICQEPSSTNTSTPVAQPQTHQDISHPYTIKWISERDTGIYNAMNKGIRMAKGEYCFFLNSGDWLYSSNVLSRIVDSKLESDIIYGKTVYVFPDNDWVYDAPEKITIRYLVNKGTIPHSGGSLIRRVLFEKFGLYDESLRVVSDWKFFLLCALGEGVTFSKINLLISYYDVSGISSTSSKGTDERHLVLEGLFGSRLLEDFAFCEAIELDYLNMKKSFESAKGLSSVPSKRLLKAWLLSLFC